MIPRRAQGDHLGREEPDESSFCRAKTGHPKKCACFNSRPTLMELKCSSREVLSSCTSSTLCKWAALRKAYGQRARWMATGQRWPERSRMAFSAIPFWKSHFVDAAEGETLTGLFACRFEIIVGKAPIVAVVMLDLDAVLVGESFEGMFCGNGFLGG